MVCEIDSKQDKERARETKRKKVKRKEGKKKRNGDKNRDVELTKFESSHNWCLTNLLLQVFLRLTYTFEEKKFIRRQKVYN